MANDNTEQNTSQFRFYGELNDLLPLKKKRKWFKHFFKGNPSIKDTIESLGVPHTEVDCILVNGKPAGFAYQLKGNQKVSVYSHYAQTGASDIKHLRPAPLKNQKFILDTHLGKLARYLRLFGFDTLYKKDYSDQDIVGVAGRERRIVLTRDIGLLKHKIIKRGRWIRATDPQKQINEVIRKFSLLGKIKPFKICLECNGKIAKIAKRKIMNRLPLKTKEYYKDFHMCLRCKRIYWQGSHYDKLSGFITRTKRQAGKNSHWALK